MTTCMKASSAKPAPGADVSEAGKGTRKPATDGMTYQLGFTSAGSL
ncbi:hypothetical protein HKCCE2091_09985 [Rhodobacterales bacterium HKCCE2091]|nr:hypothetical protein [Rhodobacterales bacterium HKCCE2091]